MAAADKILKALKKVPGVSGVTGGAKEAAGIAKEAGGFAKARYQMGRGLGRYQVGMDESVPRAALEALKGGGRVAADKFGELGASEKKQVLGTLGLGAGGALAAMGLMSGGDDEEMAEIAMRSGLPVGGDSMASMRLAMMPSIQKKISSEVLSGRDPSRILSRIERDIYEPLARQTNEMGEGEADDLYNLTEGMARVLYADAPEQDKLAALYKLAGME